MNKYALVEWDYYYAETPDVIRIAPLWKLKLDLMAWKRKHHPGCSLKFYSVFSNRAEVHYLLRPFGKYKTVREIVQIGEDNETNTISKIGSILDE